MKSYKFNLVDIYSHMVYSEPFNKFGKFIIYKVVH